MNIEVWKKEYYTLHEDFKFPCPNCNNTTLQFLKDAYKSHTEGQSRAYINENEDWEHELLTLTCSGTFLCTGCKEHVVFTGNSSYQEVRYIEKHTHKHIHEMLEEFKPIFFHPTLKIFLVPQKCPDSLKAAIIASFKLFWCELPACANKIRVSLEILMNEQRIRKTITSSNGNRRKLMLHQRIQLFENKKPEIASYLEAIKWIGNTGSHLGDVNRMDILEAYKVYEYCLRKLYSDEEKIVKQISKGINKNRGVRKR